MKPLKLTIIAFFTLFSLFIFFSQRSSPVSGQTSPQLTAPTGFDASDNAYSTKVGLIWDAIRGATNYRIFRSTQNNPATAEDIGTTAANYFHDATGTPGQTYFYWVRAENSAAASQFSTPDQGVRATGTINGPVPPLEPPPAPPGNPVTAAKAYLGKALFWDEQLSSTRTVACGTCHSGAGGGIDRRTALQRNRSENPGFDTIFNSGDDVFGSPGVISNNSDGTYNLSPIYGFREQVTGRRAMPYTDAAYPISLFWDGRATPTFRDPLTNIVVLQNGAALESQILGPPVSDAEMAHAGRDWNDVAARVTDSKPMALAGNIPAGLENWIDGRSYPQLFEEAFGTPEVTPVRIAMAIATHERTLFSDRTPLDQVIQGIGTLTQAEQRGRNLFNSPQTNCNACHVGNLFTDNQFHYIGVRPTGEDQGRFGVTGNANNLGEFRTPNLRNVSLRGAYFHNGRFTTLAEVVDFYARGGDFDAPNKAPNVRPRNLSPQQRADLVAFLSRPLTDPRVRDELPPFDRPQLYSESPRVPQINGTGRSGSGDLTPEPMAIEPPLAGNPSFTVGVSNAIGGAEAVLVIDSNDPGIGNTIPTGGVFARRTITLGGNGDGAGFGSVSLAVPTDGQTVGHTFTGRWYITDPQAQNGFSVSPAFTFTVFSQSASINKPHTDFDGDGRTDISIFRTPVGQWWYYRSSDGGNSAFQFGSSTDRIVPADYTGDGKTDVAIFRPSSGEWFVLRSEDSSFYSFPFGASTDIPAPGDFDGDGKADPTVFRPSTATWFTQASSQGTLIRSFGSSGDIPQVGDYDGDGRDDLAIFRPGDGSWWLDRSSAGLIVYTFGVGGDKPVIGDYTGDGKTDVAFWRPTTGEWFILRSEDASFYSAPFGAMGDIAAPGDYDGDGKFDLAVFRPSEATWYVSQTRDGFLIQAFGSPEDYPAPAAYVP
ncbi:MAG: cytochrome c peroxidase [Pyrinomonadaceae bacterium]